MQIKPFVWAIVSLLSVDTALATTRQALVRVINRSGEDLEDVTVNHKYSDDFNEIATWPQLGQRETTSSSMKVQYNTGLFTTGRDWWKVSWFTGSGKDRVFYTSSPNNFRADLDNFENTLPLALSTTGAVIGGTVGAVGGSVPGAGAGAGGGATLGIAVGRFFANQATTAGFKQHILREEDEDEITYIIINQDDTVRFTSKSGDSETVSRTYAWNPERMPEE